MRIVFWITATVLLLGGLLYDVADGQRLFRPIRRKLERLIILDININWVIIDLWILFQLILLIFRFQESDLDDIHFDQPYVTTQATVVSYKKTLRSTVFKQYDN